MLSSILALGLSCWMAGRELARSRRHSAAAAAAFRDHDAQRGADRVQVGPWCSVLHVPIDIELVIDLDPDLKSWLF